MHNIEIETERLLLRPMTVEDAEDVFSLREDPYGYINTLQ